MIKPASIIFIMNHGNPISEAIAWAMGSRWSHCAIAIGKINDEDVTVETSDFEVFINPMYNHLDPECEMEIWEPIEDQPPEVLWAAMRLVGQLYGYLQLISLGSRRLAMKLGLRMKNWIRLGLVCCAVPGYAYNHGTYEDLKQTDPESYDTEEFYQRIKAHTGFRLAFIKRKGSVYLEPVR